MLSDRDTEEEEIGEAELPDTEQDMDGGGKEIVSNHPSPLLENMLTDFSAQIRRQLTQQISQLTTQQNQCAHQQSQHLEQIASQQEDTVRTMHDVVGRLDKVEGSLKGSPIVRVTRPSRGTSVHSVDMHSISVASPLRSSFNPVTTMGPSQDYSEDIEARESAFRLRRSARLLNKPRPNYRRLGRVGIEEEEDTEYENLGEEDEQSCPHKNVTKVGVIPLSGVAPRESYRRTYNTSAFIIGLNYVDLFQIMNEELSKLSMWFQVNKLSLNITKSNYMIFKSKKFHNLDFSNLNLLIDNTQLARVSKVKFLGVIIDEHLTWKPHIEHVKSKVTKIVGVMYRLKGSLPKHSLKLLYTAHLSPYLHYCRVVMWDMVAHWLR